MTLFVKNKPFNVKFILKLKIYTEIFKQISSYFEIKKILLKIGKVFLKIVKNILKKFFSVSISSKNGKLKS
jgi:hypothetical protein